MVQLIESERKIIQKENPKNTLTITSENKKSGGSTYYVLGDDFDSLKILARLRKQSIKQLTEKMN
ncbi:MAG: hypothetical protein WC343_15440 [Bacilli bacterium]|jgi:hypothetical protein